MLRLLLSLNKYFCKSDTKFVAKVQHKKVHIKNIINLYVILIIAQFWALKFQALQHF